MPKAVKARRAAASDAKLVNINFENKFSGLTTTFDTNDATSGILNVLP